MLCTSQSTGRDMKKYAVHGKGADASILCPLVHMALFENDGYRDTPVLCKGFHGKNEGNPLELVVSLFFLTDLNCWCRDWHLDKNHSQPTEWLVESFSFFMFFSINGK